MTHIECFREPEIAEALGTAQWPDRCDAALVAHASRCAVCGDLVATWTTLASAWDDTRIEVRLPASGTVWWRAQMRARQDAAHAASRPVAVAQGVAAVAGGLVAVAGLVAVSPWVASSLSVSGATVAAGLADSTLVTGRWLTAGAGALLALASVALYLVVAED